MTRCWTSATSSLICGGRPGSGAGAGELRAASTTTGSGVPRSTGTAGVSGSWACVRGSVCSGSRTRYAAFDGVARARGLGARDGGALRPHDRLPRSGAAGAAPAVGPLCSGFATRSRPWLRVAARGCVVRRICGERGRGHEPGPALDERSRSARVDPERIAVRFSHRWARRGPRHSMRLPRAAEGRERIAILGAERAQVAIREAPAAPVCLDPVAQMHLPPYAARPRARGAP